MNDIQKYVGDIDSTPIDDNIKELAQKIMDEKDASATNDLISLFNHNITKKNAIRILKLNGLYDKITDQMIERVSKRSGEFSNSDLLSYLQAVENSIEKSQKSLSSPDNAPVIQVNNNTQVNLSVVDSFDNASRSRISDAIKAILQSAQQQEQQSQTVADVDYQEHAEPETDEEPADQDVVEADAEDPLDDILSPVNKLNEEE